MLLPDSHVEQEQKWVEREQVAGEQRPAEDREGKRVAEDDDGDGQDGGARQEGFPGFFRVGLSE